MKLTIDELSSSVGKAIPTFASNNVTIEELSSSLALMTSNGISCAESVTYVNSMVNELAKSGSKSDKALRELTGKGFKDLMSEGKNLSDVLKILTEYAEMNSLSLSDMFGSAEASKSALTLLKNEGKDYADVLGKINSATGTTSKNFEKVSNTSSTKLKKALNELKNSFLNIGENLEPVITKVAQGINKLADIIGNLSDEQIDNILKMTQWTIGIGAVSKVLGGAIEGVSKGVKMFNSLSGSINKSKNDFNSFSGSAQSVASTAGNLAGSLGTASSSAGALSSALGGLGGVALPLTVAIAGVGTAIYAVHEYNDMASSSCAKAREEYSAMEKVMATLSGTTLENREELENMGIIYEEFGDGISKDFQKSVENMREEIANFNFELHEMNLDDVFSDEDSKILVEKVERVADETIQTIEEKASEGKQKVEKLLAESDFTLETPFGELSLEEWSNNIVTTYDKMIEIETEQVKKKEERIIQIQEKARSEGNRRMTDQEIKEIQRLNEEILQIKLEAEARNDEELLYVKSNFRTQVTEMDAKTASELLTNWKKASDEKIKQQELSNEEFKTQMRSFYDNMTEQEQAQMEMELNILDVGLKQMVRTEEGKWKEILGVVEEENSNILDCIDMYSGKILTQKEQEMVEKLEKTKEEYRGINNITKSGMYEMYNEITGSLELVNIEYDDSINEIVGIVEFGVDENRIYTKRWAGYNEDISTSMRDTAKVYEDNWNKISTCTVNSEGKVVDSTGKVIGQIEQVIDEVGRLHKNVVEIDGHSYKIDFNTSGAITKLSSVLSYLYDIRNGAVSSVVVKGGMTQEVYASGSASVPEDTLATVNEQGWELVNPPNNATAFALGRSLQGDIAYIPEGTQISTHLSSVQQMEQAVKNEVKAQIEQENKTLVKAIDESINKAIQNLINNIDDTENVIDNNVIIDNISLTIDGKEISGAIAPHIEKSISKFNRERRR